MHHLALNVPDIMLSLFRGTFRCSDTDDPADWPWAVFWGDKDTVWLDHGEAVANMSLYLPSSFDRPPRNTALKINSGYKAWEHMYHFYNILPGLLWSLMDVEFYEHYCKLVAGARVSLLLESPSDFRPLAHKLLVEFVEDFERLYYCRRGDRLHFCRHSIHLLVHLIPETHLRGPLWLISQWPLENCIGNLTREIGSHSQPYANLAARATRRGQVNALTAIYPELGTREQLPKNAIELGDGYVLLSWGKDARAREIEGAEATALRDFLSENNTVIPDTWRPAVWKWARLRLPNEQIARTAFGECKGEARNKPVHRSRMVKVTFCLRGDKFVQVQYFFRLTMPLADGTRHTATLAMVSDFTPPDPAILEKTHGVLMVCRYQGPEFRRVVDVKEILTVVGMLPLRPRAEEAVHPDAAELYSNRFFVVQKLGFDMSWIGRGVDNVHEDDD
ncbi:hypothetical protein L226DRAFT_472677 [Lentinus tigrinus ALCF2SS1-7]|uniref:DUF4218 domain-containing protein n=1 Tax=Lentinus tigrinus ALCF2SS1-6 TaxID=1328759 RepID=A0A5C2RU57_9APHY|nr:hypothetical protein L227DRAFT_512211 [Lentinus tigrinus ALCF2SS1-6]RPD68859.1 hypothetical protein L226DRAFT_472677 [Lentinus tigrinus ALCF2SS1-7]